MTAMECIVVIVLILAVCVTMEPEGTLAVVVGSLSAAAEAVRAVAEAVRGRRP